MKRSDGLDQVLIFAEILDPEIVHEVEQRLPKQSALKALCGCWPRVALAGKIEIGITQYLLRPLSYKFESMSISSSGVRAKVLVEKPSRASGLVRWRLALP